LRLAPRKSQRLSGFSGSSILTKCRIRFAQILAVRHCAYVKSLRPNGANAAVQLHHSRGDRRKERAIHATVEWPGKEAESARAGTQARPESRLVKRIVFCCVTFIVLAPLSPCQSSTAVTSIPPPADRRTESKRILGIIPNYRTSDSLQNYRPLTIREKFKVASEDALDPGTVELAVLFGAESQLTDGNRAFGQGAAGFGRYAGAAYGDLVIGDYMTEAVFPIFLRQDPRYFRRGVGTKWSRLGYAIGQIFWTHTDAGGTQFNYSEIAGNSAAVAISQAYYKDHRTAADGASKLGMQVGVDMAGNILKEFWPEVQRELQRKLQRKNSERSE